MRSWTVELCKRLAHSHLLENITPDELRRQIEYLDYQLWQYVEKLKQMVRGHHLLRDGRGAWWDASELPGDMDSFPPIENIDALSPEQQKEKAMIDDVLKRFARTDIGGPHSFHEDPSRKLSEREKEKMRLKREKLEEHLKQFK